MPSPHTSTATAAPVQVRRANYLLTADRAAITTLLDGYARDPMGGGTALAPETLTRLCDDLAARPYAFSFIAWQGDQPLGLVNCFEAYSTFKAQPLVNIHDLSVHASARGCGVGQRLMQAVEEEAIARGACKITLEVLSGNTVALKSYNRFGFAAYQLDPAAGQAVFLQKWVK
ncbi:MAG: GNAT family N-acetyltransferase [Burkholderiaceae bacterium]